MFLGQTFGHNTLKKYVVYFGTLFNNINVDRFDGSGQRIQRMRVPLNYGPREKFLARLEGAPDNGSRPIAMQLPRMSFEMTSLYYDPARKLNALNRMASPIPGEGGRTQWQYQPVPYNIDFTLSIMTKNVEDGTFIVEQILPFFNPVWTATLRINPDLDLTYDVPITLDNITNEDTYEGDFQTRRAIIWTLTFTMKAVFFGPTRSSVGEIIRNIDINFRTPGQGITIRNSNPDNAEAITTYNIQPGQDEDGNPISYLNNTRLRTLTLDDITGTFVPTDLVRSTRGDMLSVASFNGTVMTARFIEGEFEIGDVITVGPLGASATITDIVIEPEDSISSSDVAIDSDFGFVTDITSNL